MKKAVFLFLAVMVLIGFAVKDSMAEQLCWQLSPFIDVVKVSVTATGSGHKIVNGIRFYSTSVYPVVGSFEKDPNGGTVRFLSFYSANETNGYCNFSATVDPTSTPKWQGSGGNACSNGIANSWTMVRVNCTTYAPLATTITAENNGKASSEP